MWSAPPDGGGRRERLGGTLREVVDQLAVRNHTDALRHFAPLLASVTALGAILAEPGTSSENLAAIVSPLPFVVWAWLWRGMPALLLVALAASVQFVALASGDLEPLLFLMCVAAAFVGGWEPSRVNMVAGGLLAAATPALVEAIHPDDILYGVWASGVALSLLLSRGFRWQLSLLGQLAAAREETARQAALEEKRAVARDVHDLVGHGLAAVLLHVTGARHLLRRDPDAAEEALDDAATVGRRSLQELRRTLSMLRSADHDAAALAAPLPDVDHLLEVVASARATGLDVEFRIVGDASRIDPIVGLSLHRVAEQALANAQQHAPRAVTDVQLVVNEDTVQLTVESVGPVAPTKPAHPDDRPRYGIVGMRERMAAVGGTLEAGPTPTGWLVRGQAPLAAISNEILS